MTYFVGLDVSTKTGFVILEAVAGKPVLRHCETIKVPEGLKGLKRAAYIAGHILGKLEPESISLVVIEGYSFASVERVVLLTEIGTVVRYSLVQDGFYKVLVAPPTCVKKFATGKGNADKHKVILEAHKRWGFDLSDDNQCDAAVLATMGAVHAGALSAHNVAANEAIGKLTPLV